MADPVAATAKLEDLEAQIKLNRDAETAALADMDATAKLTQAAKDKPEEVKKHAAHVAVVHAGFLAESEAIKGAIDLLKGAAVKLAAK
jgi:hypothetical protein